MVYCLSCQSQAKAFTTQVILSCIKSFRKKARVGRLYFLGPATLHCLTPEQSLLPAKLTLRNTKTESVQCTVHFLHLDYNHAQHCKIVIYHILAIFRDVNARQTLKQGRLSWPFNTSCIIIPPACAWPSELPVKRLNSVYPLLKKICIIPT